MTWKEPEDIFEAEDLKKQVHRKDMSVFDDIFDLENAKHWLHNNGYGDEQ